jgi:Flp pilus assembly protein CpaB
MNGRTLLRLGGAVILGASSALYDQPLVLFPVERTSSAIVPVVVATRAIRAGDVIDSSAVTVAQWPAMLQPAGAYASVDAIGRVVAASEILKGDAIVPGRLTRSAHRNGGF